VIQLGKHIEALLLQNDCVIVPDLGGFVAHHIAARYQEQESMFLPPLRTLGFNPQLLINDSLLVQSYVETYDLSYPEALHRIEAEVSEVKQQLETNGSYEFEGLGTLSFNEEGHYVFTPYEAGLLTPAFYALSSFEMPVLSSSNNIATTLVQEETKAVASGKETVIPKAAEAARQADSEKESSPAPTLSSTPLAEEEEEVPSVDEELQEEEEEEQTIVIKMSWLRNTAAVAAAILAFFLVSTPISNSSLQTAGSNQPSVVFGGMSKDSSKGTDAIKKINLKKTDSIAVEALQAAGTKKSDTLVTLPAQKTERTYCIVLASYITKKNAADFVSRLHKDGYTDAEVFIRKNVTRVVLGNFPTENIAYNKLNALHHKTKYFEEAWVMKR